MLLEPPTPQLIERYVEQFRGDERYFLADEAILSLFQTFPRNLRLQDILLKISVLNDLYGTNIYATFTMARHIHALDIDPHLAAHSTEIVDHIAHVTFAGKLRHVYSFATKYCSWHDQSSYPIYDSFVERVLLAYRAQDAFHDFTKVQLRGYTKYKQTLEAFRTFYGLTDYSFKLLDKALWLHGKAHFGKTSLLATRGPNTSLQVSRD